MKTSIKIEDKKIQALFMKMSSEEKKQALEDSGTFIITSTHAGYLSETSPEGEKWKENVQWYKQAKGEAAILTGPTSKTIHGGPFKDKYAFAKINTKRMRNALMVRVEGTTKAYVEYEADVKERASLTQHGGESKLILKSTTGGKNLEIDLTIPARPHLGVADRYARVGSKTDPAHIEDIFSQMVDKHIG